MDDLKQKRSDSWENCLTDEQQRELYRWVQTPFEDEAGETRRHTFDECMAHLDEMGVRRPSRPGWFRFKARMEKERRVEMLYSVRASCESAKELTAMTPADLAVAADAFTNLAIDAGMKGNEEASRIFSQSANQFRALLQTGEKLDLQRRAQGVKEEELKLAREKFEAAEKRLAAVQDAIEKSKNGTIDPAKVADEIDRILGRKK